MVVWLSAAAFQQLVIDGSYVGSQSHKLTTWETGQPAGSRRAYVFIRTSVRGKFAPVRGIPSYHAMQWRVDRRFARGFQVTGSYTWSRNIDSTSEGVGSDCRIFQSNRTSIDI